MTKAQNDYINYRIQRASDTLNDARLLALRMKDGIHLLTDYTMLASMLSLPSFITIQLRPRHIKESGLNS